MPTTIHTPHKTVAGATYAAAVIINKARLSIPPSALPIIGIDPRKEILGYPSGRVMGIKKRLRIPASRPPRRFKLAETHHICFFIKSQTNGRRRDTHDFRPASATTGLKKLLLMGYRSFPNLTADYWHKTVIYLYFHRITTPNKCSCRFFTSKEALGTSPSLP